MSQRLVRAKQKIRDAGIPCEELEPSERSERMAAVYEAIYAAITVDHGSTEIVLVDESLAEEAIFLHRIALNAIHV
jgi:RNA polymerase sigma-70 factor (ECF subfamily)